MTALGTLGALASPPCGAHRRAASDHRHEPPGLWLHEAPAPSPQPGPQVCRCWEGEPRELCSRAQAHTAHAHVHTCQRARTEPSHLRREARACVLPGCTIRDSGWVCGPFQGMTTGPGDSHPRGGGATEPALSEPRAVYARSGFHLPALRPGAAALGLGPTDQSQLREGGGEHGAETRELPGAGLLGRSQARGAGPGPRGCRGVRMSRPCHGPPAGGGRRNVVVCL